MGSELIAPATPDVELAVPLLDSRVLAMCNPYEVDGRVSWHPPGARGTATFNCYALVEDSDVMLIDTGLTVHQDRLLRQLRTIVGERRLTVAVLRQGEFDSLCNLFPIAEEFGIDALLGQFDDVVGWAAFRPEYDALALRLRSELRNQIMHSGDVLSVGVDTHRTVRVEKPTLRLLTNLWMYDDATRTLFSSDTFTHVLSPSAAGPWVVTADSDTTTYEQVRDHMLGTRYWWVSQADTTVARRDLAKIFDELPIEAIAPAWGCPLVGASVVERHFQMVDQVLYLEGRR